MKSMPKRLTKRNKVRHSFYLLLGFIMTVFVVSGCGMNSSSENEPNNNEEVSTTPPDPNNNENEEDSHLNTEESYTEIRLAAVGDIMFHDEQLRSAYHEETDSYDFQGMFTDVEPILSAADLTLANFETTMAGPERPYIGYPQFNSPDEVADAIQSAGVDVLTTVNNHSLDTRDTGLKRTVKVLREKGFATVGTYDEKPDSRVLIQEVKGIKFAILAYTESTNGLGDQYPKDELDAMLNLMEKDKIKTDIQEAKDLDADFIITFMHWGTEYAEEPNTTQVDFAEMMAAEGVDLILGSHPHVIQKSDIIKTEEKDTYVIYSMGNFISNQRVETLGEERKPTEDGIIVNFDIRKNDKTGETVIQNVEYIPTWVYRHKEEDEETYTYRVLPIENFLVDDVITEAYRARMEEALEMTTSKMIQDPF